MPHQQTDTDRELLVRIDERTLEMKESLIAKADAERVARLEKRQDKAEQKQDSSDRKLNYILGGLVVFEAALKFVAR